MDLSAFTADMDDLVAAFVQVDGQELSQMKELWRSRSFSFIHEARPPSVKEGFFMQSLYSSALDFMQRTSKLSRKLGGLYVCYILYETQLSVPSYKIYLSTEDLENLHSLVKEAKANNCVTALRVVNRMMARDFFLYGSVTVSGRRMKETYREVSNRATERVNKARKRILSNSYAEGHFEGNLMKDLGLDGFSLLNEEYAMAKQRVFKGGSTITQEDLGNLGTLVGDELITNVKNWMEKRKQFFGKEEQDTQNMLSIAYPLKDDDEETGPECPLEESAIDSNVSVELDDLAFEKELEDALEED